MKRLFYTLMAALMMATTASAQFVITRKNDTKANYDGQLTFKQTANSYTVGGVSLNDIYYITRKQNIKLTDEIKGNYFEGLKSQSSEGAANYYLILTNDPDLEISQEQQYMPTTKGGVVFSLDIYGADSQDKDNAVIPEGTYPLDETTAAGTIDLQTTFARVMNPAGVIEYKTLKSGSVTVKHVDGGYAISGTFVSDQGETFTAQYQGALTFDNKSESSQDNLMVADVENTVFKGVTVTAHGGDETYSRYTLQLFDGTDNGGLISDGIVVNVDLFSTTPEGDDIIIADGTYEASADYEDIETFEAMKFLPGACYTVIGYPLNIGTYIQDLRIASITGTTLYGYANKGTVTVKRDGDKYSFKLDLTTRNGIHITGEYPMGEVLLVDRRPEAVDDRLKEDRTLVFSHDTYSYAYCTPGYENQNAGEHHDGVNEFELVMNDHITNESFLLDLVLPADKRTPEGTYTVADAANDKYDPYTFVPGYYVGITSVRRGTWGYEHYVADSTEPDIVGVAVDGTINITKNADGTYTVQYQLKTDGDPQHTMTASWTGKINIIESGFDEE